MPELPEVNNIINYLKNHEHLTSKTISSVDVLYDYTVETDKHLFIDSLKNKKVEDITQKGKYIIFHLSDNLVIVSHLRMEGKYFLKKEDEKNTKHDLVIFHFIDGTKLVYNDTRRFGRMILLNENNYLNVPPLNKVGPEPFEDIPLSYLKERYQTKNIALKQLLLDQSIISGIGNIYADEICFDIKLNPRMPGKFLNDNDLLNIISSARKILTAAIKFGGSTIKTYHIAVDKEGNYQSHLNVYDRENKPCKRCGYPLRKIFLNGRGTTFCPRCEIDKSLPFVLALTGPIASGKSSINAYFVKKGYISLDLDNIVHEVYKDKNVQIEIKKIIPSLKIIDGIIDRAYLKQYLIDHKEAKNALENYLYDGLYNLVLKKLRKIGPNKKVVMDVPLLFKSHLDDFANKILLIKINPDIQKERLEKRSGNSDSYLKLNKSYFEQENIKKADYIISNNSNLEDLYNQLDTLNI